MIERRPLGGSDLQVSRLALGSWRTFERIGRDQGLAVVRAAREHGINFLDDARYDDETGNAPIPTGYSEVLFGELFRAAGWDRDDTNVANELWWEFWPEQSAAAELDASLGRMQFDYVDLIYANPPPQGLPVGEMVAAVGELISAGKARWWGIVNWEAEQFLEASRAAAELGVAQPCAAQLPYSLVRREWVESAAMDVALTSSGAGVVASFVLGGGVLTGKYGAGATGHGAGATGSGAGATGSGSGATGSGAGATGRAAGEIDDPRLAAARERGVALRSLASELGVAPAACAIAFALANPAVTSVLFGATSPAQLAENAGALAVDALALRRVLDGQ